MTEEELRLRNQMANDFADIWYKHDYHDAWQAMADHARNLYKQAGYVQLDEDQSYPPIPRKDIVHIIMERDTQLRKANFKKVKSD